MKKNINTISMHGEGGVANSTQIQRQLLRPLNSLEKLILQKYREPTILENSRDGFIESVNEN